jgi:hypothetical protein
MIVLLDVSILELIFMSCILAMCTHHFDRPVNGACVECRVLFRDAKNAYHQKAAKEGLSWRPLF